ncbi:MAG: hypothetical protein WD904_13165 [Dehalococcoidia bacterium]
MAYVRVSTMKPQSGSEEDVRKLNEELVAFYRSRPGCIASHFIAAADESGEQGRVTFWESESLANSAATNDHSMFLRSRLHLLVEHGHLDRSFHADLGVGASVLAGTA